MAINVIIGGVSYTIPETGERAWGKITTDTLVALANLSGRIDGLNPNSLASEAVFTNFGLKAPYYKSETSDVSSTGIFRLANIDTINWRNFANTDDIELSVNASDKLVFDGNQIALSGDLTDHIDNPTGAHAASAISNTPSGNLAATDVQGALDELQTEVDPNTVHRSSDGTDHANVVLNDTHRASDGKDHSDVVLNNTHRGSDGTDHANVVLNDTHRASDGKDHSDVVLNNTHRASDGSDHSKVVANESAIALNTTHRTSDGKDHSDVVLNNTHRGQTDNPHSVTQTQVGLGNVDNTSDADKPISTATQTALDAKVDETSGTATLLEIASLDSLSIPGTTSSDPGTGGEITVSNPLVRFNNASLTSIGGIISGKASDKWGYIVNETGADITVVNEDTGVTTADRRILTGTGEDLILADGAMLHVVYDSVEARWRIGSGSGGAGGLALEIKTASFTAEAGKHYLVDTTSGAVTVTAPAVADKAQWAISDLAKNFGTNACTIEPDGSDTVDGASQLVMRDNDGAYTFNADLGNTNWVVDKNVIAGNGAIVSEWEDYSPTITGVTTSTNAGTWRRVGNDMELRIRIVYSAAPTGDVTFALPAGYTLDTSRLPASASGLFPYGRASYKDNSTAIVYDGSPESANGVNTFDFWGSGVVGAWDENSPSPSPAAADSISASLLVPIAEWAGGGTTNTQTQVEYAFNTDTSDANDITSFGYGPEGTTVPSIPLTAARDKTVQFINEIKATDTVVLQVKFGANGAWTPLAVEPNGGVVELTYQGNYYGMGIIPDTSDARRVKVRFGQYRLPSSTYNGVGSDWSGGTKWRVVKHTNAALVGVEHGTSLKRGTIGGSNGIINNGTATYVGGNGEIGEVIFDEDNTHVTLLANGSYDNLGTSIVLDKGIWTINITALMYTVYSSGTGYSIANLELYNGSTSLFEIGAKAGNSEVAEPYVPFSGSITIALTSATTLSLRHRIRAFSGSPSYSGAGVRGDYATTRLEAVRIG